jgi:hypothetical protein
MWIRPGVLPRDYPREPTPGTSHKNTPCNPTGTNGKPTRVLSHFNHRSFPRDNSRGQSLRTYPGTKHPRFYEDPAGDHSWTNSLETFYGPPNGHHKGNFRQSQDKLIGHNTKDTTVKSISQLVEILWTTTRLPLGHRNGLPSRGSAIGNPIQGVPTWRNTTGGPLHGGQQVVTRGSPFRGYNPVVLTGSPRAFPFHGVPSRKTNPEGPFREFNPGIRSRGPIPPWVQLLGNPPGDTSGRPDWGNPTSGTPLGEHPSGNHTGITTGGTPLGDNRGGPHLGDLPCGTNHGDTP